MISSKRPFPCFACGKCCQNIGNSPQAIYLDRGDGTCRHFDDNTKRCSIYSERPIFCRIEEFYDLHLSKVYEWEEFIEMNLKICHQLNEVND